MKIRSSSYYSDGHSSSTVETVPEFTGDPEDLQDYLFDFTGDGHGAGRDLGYCYSITILKAENPELVGREFEWSGA